MTYIIKDITTNEEFTFTKKHKAYRKFKQIRLMGHDKEAYVIFADSKLTMWENTWSEK